MGLIVSVYRADRGDCTNGGISARASQLCLVNVNGPFEPSHDMPAAILTTNNVGHPVIKPAHMHHDGVWGVESGWFMMGGNYAATSDSRFSEAVAKLLPGFYGALPIHDRQE